MSRILLSDTPQPPFNLTKITLLKQGNCALVFQYPLFRCVKEPVYNGKDLLLSVKSRLLKISNHIGVFNRAEHSMLRLHMMDICRNLLVHISRHVESRWQPIHCIIVSILWTIGNDETVQHRY